MKKTKKTTTPSAAALIFIASVMPPPKRVKWRKVWCAVIEYNRARDYFKIRHPERSQSFWVSRFELDTCNFVSKPK